MSNDGDARALAMCNLRVLFKIVHALTISTSMGAEIGGQVRAALEHSAVEC